MTFAFALLFMVILQITFQNHRTRDKPLPIQRINEKIVLDGHINDGVWNEIEPLPLVAYTPIAGLPPSEKTEIRFAHDDRFLYASIRAWDSDPSAIRANTLYRDRYRGDDHIHILLDTFNDNESAMIFVVTPTGARRDQLVSNDGEGNAAINTDFNTFWDASASIDSRGWYAEIRVPFTSLGFQDVDGRVIMGLYVQRGITRKNERVTFPEVPDYITRAYFKPSLAQKIVLDGVNGRQSLHITPYLTGGLEQQTIPDITKTGYSTQKNQKLDTGLDFKYGISNNITLDVTVNTYFAQVEADDEQANLTRFNIFSPEKRQFFLERSGLFEFNTEDSGRLFHSRRIGLTEDGESVRILGGGRFYGRIGSWDVGFLNLQTDDHQ